MENDIFDAIKRQEALRGSHAAFDAAADTWLLNTGSDRVLGIGRYYQGEKVLALFNFSDVEQTVELGDPTAYTNLWTDEVTTARVVHLNSGGFLWLAQTVK